MAKIKTESLQKSISDPLLEPFFVTVDQYCYTVNLRVTPDPKNIEEGKEGKEYTKVVGHYSSFNSCLEIISKQKLNTKNYSSVKEYLNEFNAITNQLKTLTQL